MSSARDCECGLGVSGASCVGAEECLQGRLSDASRVANRAGTDSKWKERPSGGGTGPHAKKISVPVLDPCASGAEKQSRAETVKHSPHLVESGSAPLCFCQQQSHMHCQEAVVSEEGEHDGVDEDCVGCGRESRDEALRVCVSELGHDEMTFGTSCVCVWPSPLCGDDFLDGPMRGGPSALSFGL